jgi:dipeptidyl aminopeptidase/acylaminoacyl peptidase
MMNWVAGKPLAKKFKAIVNHDGIFSLSNLLGSDISFGTAATLGGDLWDDQKKWDDQDPSRLTANWSQPMLIIHSDLDYRCTSPIHDKS